MDRRSLPLVGALLILISVSASRAEVIVKTEQVNAANPAGKVKTIPEPSKSDIASPPKVTDVWVAFKTHFDIGYTDTIEGVLRKYRVKMMDSALGIIDQERQLPPEKRFVWIIPGWPLTHILGPKQEPARKPRIEQALREGTLAVQALPFSLHTESSDLEDLVRGMRFSSAIARKYGRPLPIAAKMTDVPCHSWVWPTILAHAGVKFLQIGSNGASGHLRLPHLFWWEGPDGSRILCNYTPDYGSNMAVPSDWPSKNYLAMIMTGDNQGPPSLAEVENLRQYAAKNMPGIRVHFGDLDDFARGVLAEKPELPVVRADMPDTWIHGWLSMPIESKAARTAHPLQPAVEALDTQLRAWGLTTGDLAPALTEAYEQSVLYSEHTFGPAAPNMGSWNSGTLRDLYGAAWKAAYDRGLIRNTSRSSTASGPMPARRRRSSTASLAAGWICWLGRLRLPVRGSSSTTPCLGRAPARPRFPLSPASSFMPRTCLRTVTRPIRQRVARASCPWNKSTWVRPESLTYGSTRHFTAWSSTCGAAASRRWSRKGPGASWTIAPALTPWANSCTSVSATSRWPISPVPTRADSALPAAARQRMQRMSR